MPSSSLLKKFSPEYEFHEGSRAARFKGVEPCHPLATHLGEDYGPTDLY